jgi:hypothetical protein
MVERLQCFPREREDCFQSKGREGKTRALAASCLLALKGWVFTTVLARSRPVVLYTRGNALLIPVQSRPDGRRAVYRRLFPLDRIGSQGRACSTPVFDNGAHAPVWRGASVSFTDEFRAGWRKSATCVVPIRWHGACWLPHRFRRSRSKSDDHQPHTNR